MFRGLFKSHDKDDEYFEPVDPVVEQRRKEKFSTPLIYSEEAEKKAPNVVKKRAEKPIQVNTKKKEEKTTPKYEYQPMQVISPMRGITDSKVKIADTKKTPIKPKKRKIGDQLVPVISPFYGTYSDKKEEEEVEKEAILQTIAEEKNAIEAIDGVFSVEENLRNIAKIVQEEKDQLKIIEERTGEFKLDFSSTKVQEEPSLIDEIDDTMSLDELMSLYEKKFAD